MIKLDGSYSDYTQSDDPKYPGGKAVDASSVELFDGTPLLASWMNDVQGARQALVIEAFGDISSISGAPDNVDDSDVLKAIKRIGEKYTDDVVSRVVKELKEVETQMWIKYFMTHRWVQGAPYEDNGIQKILPKPSDVFNFDGYRWREIPRHGRVERGAGGLALPFGAGEQGDAIRNIKGSTAATACRREKIAPLVEKPFVLETTYAHIGDSQSHGWDQHHWKVFFDASLVVPTAEENRMVNDTVRHWILEKL